MKRNKRTRPLSLSYLENPSPSSKSSGQLGGSMAVSPSLGRLCTSCNISLGWALTTSPTNLASRVHSHPQLRWHPCALPFKLRRSSLHRDRVTLLLYLQSLSYPNWCQWMASRAAHKTGRDSIIGRLLIQLEELRKSTVGGHAVSKWTQCISADYSFI